MYPLLTLLNIFLRVLVGRVSLSIKIVLISFGKSLSLLIIFTTFTFDQLVIVSGEIKHTGIHFPKTCKSFRARDAPSLQNRRYFSAFFFFFFFFRRAKASTRQAWGANHARREGREKNIPSRGTCALASARLKNK